ncbi:TPA: LysR family transcriptional regulator [Acinetobacter baumannii]|uniref:LysR family transcriptional regulator n=1 Tax=Acinetobacter baumannii TaxID=470 RepID=UPI002296A48C|nr:LysR substrate-binding domain-containing protein [Acinetobacter baumannii]MDY7272850.1 LysR substrate-binding domain-containing protein [Acinetobacter baumannii]MDY7416683.1 LysR substrate-binding domain-containing protein [Acinetobacter baumannii]MDY7420607.1 LysR substrate-binding domain-containing protein [Acinetobacter baumannii]HCT1753463.1 LysR family transcriptional regulator [Acinetobacter baumannii]HCT2573432.1 LysR family transcriptional regulator [Acinetobacter baumannii]
MLDLYKLHAFVVVVEERNITHAANRLFIQQPPLTRLLKKLEQELGTQLLIRQPRGIEPTEAGLALFKEAQLLLEHARHIPKLVQDVSQGKTGQLNIGFTSSAGLHPLISLVLRSYREIYPAVQTKLEEAGSQKQLDWLISEKLDIAFLRAPISRDIGLKHLHILNEPMVVALPIGHPLTQKKKISLSNLSEENFVLYRRSSGQGLYDNILYSCGFSPRIIQEAPRPTATLNLVAAGIGISIVPASMHNFWDHEIVYREFDDSIKLNAPIYLITRENENSAKVSNFIELMQKLLPTMT